MGLSGSVEYWIGVLATAVLSALLAGNNTTVAVIHEAQVARWRHILTVTIIGFMLGGLTSAYLMAPYFEMLTSGLGMGVVHATTSLVPILLALISEIALILGIATTLGIAIPGSLLVVVGLAAVAGMMSPKSPIPPLEVVVDLVAANGIVALASLLLTAIGYFILMRTVMDSEDPLGAALAALPYLYVLLVPIHLSLFICGQVWLYSQNLKLIWLLLIGSLVLLVTGGLTMIWARLFMVNKTKRRVYEQHPQHVLEYAPGRREERLAERGLVVGRESPAPSASDSEASLSKSRAEETFALFLLTTCGFAASVRGIVDVGTILGLYRFFAEAAQTGEIIWWSFPIFYVLCGAGGILILGNRVTKKLTTNIVAFNPSLAVAVELGCFLPALVAIFLGWPISPGLCKLPAVLMIMSFSGRGFQTRSIFFWLAAIVLTPLLLVALITLTVKFAHVLH